MPRVTHFEISANEPATVIAFYTNVFGWKIDKWEGPEDYWLITTGPKDEPGIDGAIFRAHEMFSGTVNSIEVPNIDKFIARVKASGGEVVTAKMTIPGVGYHAYCKDVEGTIFGLHQPDSNAGMPEK